MDRTKTFRISLLESFWKVPLFFTQPSVWQWEELGDKGWRDRLAPSAPGARIITRMLLGTGQSHDGSRGSQQFLPPSSFFWRICWGQTEASVAFSVFGHSQPFSFAPHCWAYWQWQPCPKPTSSSGCDPVGWCSPAGWWLPRPTPWRNSLPYLQQQKPSRHQSQRLCPSSG